MLIKLCKVIYSEYCMRVSQSIYIPHVFVILTGSNENGDHGGYGLEDTYVILQVPLQTLSMWPPYLPGVDISCIDINKVTNCVKIS